MDLDILKQAVDALQAKLDGFQHLKELDSATVQDLRGVATTAKEAKDAAAKLEADLEKLPAKLREDFKNYLDTIPNAKTENLKPAGEWLDLSKMKAEDFAATNDERPKMALGSEENMAHRKSWASPAEKEAAIEKAAATNVDGTIGSLTQQAILWHKAIVGDPWVMAGAMQVPLSAPNFKTVEASDISFATINTDARRKPAQANFAANQLNGQVDELEHSAKTHVVRAVVSWNQDDDLSGLSTMFERMIGRAYGKQRGKLTSDKVAAAVAQELVSTNSGKSLEAENAINQLMQLTVQGEMADYWPSMPNFMLNPADAVTAFEAVSKSGGFALNPQTGLMQLASWPIHVDTQAEAIAANNHPSFFGAWDEALIQAQLGRLTVDRFLATIPGAIVFYAQFRFEPVVILTDAYVGLKTKA